ncbi:hypothetical protein V2J09_019581 [Rumex salicifolius]
MKPQRMQPMAYFIIWALSFVVQSARSDPQVPCFFVFGDSLSDNGNNNGLQTDAKVNYSPYGIDFPGQIPTGRFSNGRNVVDVIAEHLGFEESVPSYASTAEMDEDILLKGVNYASGSAGILQETGQHLGVRIPLNEQLQNHGTVVSKISSRLGNGSSSYLKRCFYMINIGSNDYFNNYYMPDHYLTSHTYSRHQYAQVLIQQYSQQVQNLYEMGARKVALFGLGELGCVPQAISKYGALKKLCYNHMNIASVFFNNRLRKLVDELNLKLTDAHFTCINMDVISPTSSLKFGHLTVPCCKVKSNGQCEEGSTPCANRKRYVFFDNFHPTEAMNEHIGRRAYSASTKLDVHPVDIRTLIQTGTNYFDYSWFVLSGLNLKDNIVGLATALVLLAAAVCARGDPLVPCFFIFGDSLSDSGNNNRLSSLAKANFLPYGVDFPGGPTGRFTNGRTTVDLIGKTLFSLFFTHPRAVSDHLGLDGYIPPFTSTSGDDVLKGVNYASGSSGILNQTGSGVGARIAMDRQLQNHQEIISKITEILGKDKVDDHLSSCLYSVYAGSNDYMLNYFMSKTATSIVTAGIVQQNVKPPVQFTESLISHYSQQLQTLYGLGARKVVVFGLGPLGCLPLLNQTGKCSDDINNALQLFNTKVRSLVDEFNQNLTGAQYIFVDTMKIVSPDLSALGLKVTDAPCCGVRQIFCLPYTSACSDRNAYAFWDNAHPTEAANRVLADRAYNAQDEDDTYPMDISHLVNASMVASQAANLDKLMLSFCVVLCTILLCGSESYKSFLNVYSVLV